MEAEKIKVNNRGYVKFASRSYRYKGDIGSWARVKTDHNGQVSLTVKRANRGFMSAEYTKALSDFCAEFGIDFGALACGASQTVQLNKK